MDGTLGVIIVVAVVVLVVGIALVASARFYSMRRTAALRRQFGSEYDRVISELGRRHGESELRGRLELRQSLSIRHLGPDERATFERAWDAAQGSFVDTPAAGLRDADLLVMQVMRDRGYPVEHVEQRVKVISVDYPDLVEHFRAARDVAVASEQDHAGTEEQRQAMVDYRFLFDELLEGGDPQRSQRA